MAARRFICVTISYAESNFISDGAAGKHNRPVRHACICIRSTMAVRAGRSLAGIAASIASIFAMATVLGDLRKGNQLDLRPSLRFLSGTPESAGGVQVTQHRGDGAASQQGTAVRIYPLGRTRRGERAAARGNTRTFAYSGLTFRTFAVWLRLELRLDPRRAGHVASAESSPSQAGQALVSSSSSSPKTARGRGHPKLRDRVAPHRSILVRQCQPPLAEAALWGATVSGIRGLYADRLEGAARARVANPCRAASAAFFVEDYARPCAAGRSGVSRCTPSAN
jgi:hypothetical protein